MPKSKPVITAAVRGEEQDPQVQAHVELDGVPGAPVGDDPHQRADAQLRQHDAQQSARAGKQQRLGDGLPHQPGTGGAERNPHRHFALPRGAASQQQAGDIGACDHQQQPNHGHQHKQRLRVAVAQARHAGAGGLHLKLHDAQKAIAAGLFVFECPPVQYRQFRARPIEGDSRFQPPYQVQSPGRIGRYPDLLPRLRLQPGELAGRDTDNRHRNVLHDDLPAQDGGIEAEPALPEEPAHHRDGRRCARTGIVRSDQAADGRFQTEHGEVVSSDVRTIHVLGLRARGPHAEPDSPGIGRA